MVHQGLPAVVHKERVLETDRLWAVMGTQGSPVSTVALILERLWQIMLMWWCSALAKYQTGMLQGVIGGDTFGTCTFLGSKWGEDSNALSSTWVLQLFSLRNTSGTGDVGAVRSGQAQECSLESRAATSGLSWERLISFPAALLVEMWTAVLS